MNGSSQEMILSLTHSVYELNQFFEEIFLIFCFCILSCYIEHIVFYYRYESQNIPSDHESGRVRMGGKSISNTIHRQWPVVAS